MTNQCPECGSFTRVDSDPALPPHLGNERCPSETCEQDVVREAVELPEDQQPDEQEDEAEDLIEIENAAEAADILCSNLTSAELSEFSREHAVLGYSGKTKRAKAENIVLQQPEAVAEWLDEQELVTPAEGLAETLRENGLEARDGLHRLAGEVQSSTLARRLNALYEAVLENERTYRVTNLEVGEYFISITVRDPDQCRFTEGELGDSRFTAWLGPQGGVQKAHEQNSSGFENDMADSRRGWARFCENVADAK